MRKFLIPALAGAILGGAGLASLPASAAVSGPASGVQAADTVEQARMTRRHRMTRHRMMRGQRMARPRGASDMNAKNPALRGDQQGKGNTSGGPRY